MGDVEERVMSGKIISPKKLEDLKTLSLVDLNQVPLEDIAFLISQERYPETDFTSYRERLDEFAERAKRRIGNVIGSYPQAEGLSQYLFEEEGFRGNASDYYSPSNSFINDVLDRREGIPLTLSIVFIAIGKRLGLPVSGVGFPGHFMVRFEDPKEPFYIDPFYRGKILTEVDCRQKLLDLYGDEIPFRPEYLLPATHRDILMRVLTNLKVAFMIKKDFEKALLFLNHFLSFNPLSTEEIKERGMLYYHMECFSPALQDLKAYLRQKPSTEDRFIIEECIKDLTQKVAGIQ